MQDKEKMLNFIMKAMEITMTVTRAVAIRINA
jgi:hypothetical protein